MPNAREITLNVEGVPTRYVGGTYIWQAVEGYGCGREYRDIPSEELAEMTEQAMCEELYNLQQANKLLTTELETARAEMAIYRAQRDQVSAETTIDEERFQRVFWEAFREWERSVSMGFGDLTRQVLSRYLAEMTAMKPPDPDIYIRTLTAEQMSGDEIIIPPPEEA